MLKYKTESMRSLDAEKDINYKIFIYYKVNYLFNLANKF